MQQEMCRNPRPIKPADARPAQSPFLASFAEPKLIKAVVARESRQSSIPETSAIHRKAAACQCACR
jgi:hypothetical protein